MQVRLKISQADIKISIDQINDGAFIKCWYKRMVYDKPSQLDYKNNIKSPTRRDTDKDCLE